MNGLPELLAKLEESLTLTRLDGDSAGELAPQNLVLDLEVTDLASQFFVRRGGDHVQDGLEDARHGVILLKCCTAKEMATFLHPRSGPSGPSKLAKRTPLGRRACLIG